MQQFSSWYPLTRQGVETHAPEAPAVLQIRRREGLVDYEEGRSAMVCYLFASESAHAMLLDFFSEEIDEPGARGEGPLQFRYLEATREEETREQLADMIYKFVRNFGETPRFNRDPDLS